MPEEYLDDDAILEKSYKYLSKFIVNRSEKISEKLISHIEKKGLFPFFLWLLKN